MYRQALCRRWAALFLSLAVLGCQGVAPRTLPDITFADMPPIGLDVARIEVVQRYQPPLADPYVDHLFPKEPASVIRRWADDRLAARGPNGTATLYIEDASVVEEALARSPGLRGAIVIEESERYTANFKVRLEVSNPATGRSGYSNVTAQRFVTVLENASLAAREQTWFELTEKTIRDLDAEFERQVRRNLSEFLVP